MRTIGNHIPPTAVRGDYPCLCDYCGAPWMRSQLRKDGADKLFCPDEGDGLDATTLNDLDAAAALQDEQTSEPRDGKFAKLPLQDTPATLASIVGTGGRS